MTQSQSTKTMDALVLLGPRRMEMRREPIPTPAAGEVLVEVDAVGICGSELGGYLGTNTLRVPPVIMGHEVAGRIVAVTEGVLADGQTPQVGQKVAVNPVLTCGQCDRCRAGLANLCRTRKVVGAHCAGAYAQWFTVPASQCWPMPQGVSQVGGALAEPLACAVRAVSLGGVEAGKSLLILGAGTIGLCCLAVARSRGVEQIIISDISDRRLDIARRWGAHEVLNSDKVDVTAATIELTGGGADVVIDAVGADVTREQAIAAVIPGCQVVFIGLHEERSELALNYIIRQEVKLTGSFAYTQNDFGRALDLLQQKVITPTDDWLDQRPLNAGTASFEELIDGTSDYAKIMLMVSP